MDQHLYLSVNLSSQMRKDNTDFLRFDDLASAEAFLKTWLTRQCDMDCYATPEEAAALKAQNGGVLPETAFACPPVACPKDLERYSDFYDYQELGNFSVEVTALYDETSALQFRDTCIREYLINNLNTPAAEEMIAMLDVLVQSFREPVDDTDAVQQVRRLVRGGELAIDP